MATVKQSVATEEFETVNPMGQKQKITMSRCQAVMPCSYDLAVVKRVAFSTKV